MPRRIEYYNGQILNANTQTIYLKEKEKSTYKSRRALFKCGKCNTEFEADIKSVKDGHTCCPVCKRENKIKQQEQQFVVGDILNQYGSTYLGEAGYKGNKRYVYYECGYCHSVSCGRLDQIKSKVIGCGLCRDERHTKYRVGDIIESVYGVRYKFDALSDETTPAGHRLGIFYQLDNDNNPSGGFFIAQPTNVALGFVHTGVSSKAERVFDKQLTDLKIKHFNQFAIDSLKSKNGGQLRFDFLVLFNNKKILVELDGEQHYRAVDYFGGIDNFYSQKERDNQKDNFVQSQSEYLLLRIPYWDFNKLIDTEFILMRLKEV